MSTMITETTEDMRFFVREARKQYQKGNTFAAYRYLYFLQLYTTQNATNFPDAASNLRKEVSEILIQEELARAEKEFGKESYHDAVTALERAADYAQKGNCLLPSPYYGHLHQRAYRELLQHQLDRVDEELGKSTVSALWFSYEISRLETLAWKAGVPLPSVAERNYDSVLQREIRLWISGEGKHQIPMAAE